MNYYWWRSNGESGQSGYIHAKSEDEVRNKIESKLNEDIYVVLMEKRVKSNRFTGELYS